MSNIKSYSSALSGMISDYEGESRGMLSVRAGFLVSERGSQPVSLNLWTREDNQPAYGVDPVNLRAAIKRPKVSTITRAEKLELAFWDKFTGEFTLDSVVGCMYMRARSADELSHAAHMLSKMGANKARKTIQYIRARIRDDQLYRIMNKLRLDPALSTSDNIRVYNEPRISAVHLSILSDKVRAHDVDYFWAKLRKIARIPVCGGVSGAVNEVVAQAGLFGDTSWSRAIGDSLKKLAAQLKKFAECGVAGRIVIYIALGFLVSKVMDFLPWWAVVAMLTCAEIGWISDFGSEIAEVVADGCGIDDTDIHFPAFGEPLDVWNNRYGDNGDPHVSLATSYGSLRLGSVVAQSGASYTMLTLGLTALIARRVPMYSKIINITKFKLGLEEVFKGVEGSLEALVNLVLRSFNSKNVFRFRQQSDMVGRVVDDVDKLDVLVRAKGCEIDEAMYQRFSGLVAQIEEAITQWPRDSAEWRALKKAMGVLTKLSCDYPAHFNSAKARIEPIGLMLSGDPGLGKTTLLKAITKIIAKYEFPDEPFDMAKHMFQKPTGQYYEGYKGQTVFCLDDVFTKQPVAGETDGDAETIVRLINQWPLALNMANCALKGRFYMTSPYVIATSNIKKMDGLKKAVVDEKAILRRFPLWYGVELVEGARIGPNVHPDEVWRFKAIDFSDTGNTGEYITFTQLMKRLFAERRRRIDYAKSDVVGDDYINELMGDITDEQNALSAVASIRGIIAQSGRAATTLKAVGIGACAALTARALLRAAGHAAGSAITRMRERIAHRVPEILNKVVEVGARQMAKMAVVILLMVAALRGLKTVARGFAGLFTKNASIQKDGAIVAQAGARDEVVELVQRNMFIIYCGDVRLGFGLGVDDMTMVLPGHFVEESRRKHHDLVAVGRRGVKIVLKEIVKHDEARDTVYFRAKTMCRDLTKSHITADVRETNLLLVRPNSIVECSTTLCPKSVTYSGSPEFKPIRRSLHVHTAKTDYGDCGAVIMAATGKGGRRIYGFHTAADLSERKYTGCFTTFGDAVVAQSGGTFCGHEIIRKIDKPIHNGGDTRLEPTPYAGLFGDVLTLPSAKRPNGEVDPMLKAISGYKRDWPDVPPEIPACVSAVVAEIFDALKGHDLGPVGMWEAAAGIAGEPYCKGLARGKSPGYPFIERYHDKKMMLGSDGPYVKGPAYGELEEAVRSLENTYRAGGQGAVYRDSLKDEPRKVEKVRTCATRMISGCPVELAVLGRMQTLKFTSALMQTRHEHGIMPGFNPYGIEANQLFHRLAFVNKTQTATAGDYKEFDKTQHPVAMKLIWDDISRRLVVHGCDSDVLAGLGRDTFNAMHLGGNSYVSDTIYKVDGTLPSGHWMTSFLNSIYNAVIIRYCWVKYKGGLEHVYEFSRHVAAVYYGDDFVLAADDANAGFGLNKLQEFVAHMGMVMTDEDGNFGGEPCKSIFDVSFLCRKFRVAKSGVVWMPLELDSINDMFNWKKRSTPIQQHTEAIIRASLMEAAAHPIDTFVVYYKKCQALADKYIPRFPELSLPLEQAYDHWKMVHKGHIPIWSDEEE